MATFSYNVHYNENAYDPNQLEEAVNLRSFSQRAVSFIRSQHERTLSRPDTSRFLKERNARLIIQTKGSRSFSGQRLDTTRQFNIGGEVFRIDVHLSTPRMLSISVTDEHSRHALHSNMPISDDALALSLDLDNTLLKIEIDAAPLIDVHQ